MGILIPLLALIVPNVIYIWRQMNGKGYKCYGERRFEIAKARGDRVMAKLGSKFFSQSQFSSRQSSDEWRCKYYYRVDGKEYSFKIATATSPAPTMEIYFDRDHGNRRIDPQKMSILDHLYMLFPIILAIVLFIILNVL